MPYKNKLNEQQIDKLLVDYEDGFKIVELAPRYGVSVRTVSRYLSDAGVKQSVNTRRTRKDGRREPNPVQLMPCGTNAAYVRHKRNKEYPCLACTEEHNRLARERKARRK